LGNEEEKWVDRLAHLHKVLAEQEPAGWEVRAGAKPAVRVCDVGRAVRIAAKHGTSTLCELLLHVLQP
jgi:hypothetical protein